MVEISIVSYEDIDLYEGLMSIKINGYTLEHVDYYAEKELIDDKGQIGSVHSVELCFNGHRIELDSDKLTGIIYNKELGVPYTCTGIVHNPMIIGKRQFFLLECGMSIIVRCIPSIEVTEGKRVSAQGTFEIRFIESEIYKLGKTIEQQNL